MTFREWLDITFYPGFDASGLDDQQYWDLEDLYNQYEEEELGIFDDEEDF
jgi:hypothetical protein